VKHHRPLSLSSLFPAVLLACLSAVAGCGGGSGGSSLNAIVTAVQDLSANPEGVTTVVTFRSTRGLPLASAANFEADGGQTAQTVTVAGDTVTITWSARVSPSDRVRATGLSGVDTTFHAVTTSNASAPTFTIVSGTQNPGLGGDTIQVAFSGPHVVVGEAENLGTWTLSTDGQVLDLAGSTFVLNTGTQVLDITLGTMANLHANFSLGATGLHSVADVLVSSTPVAGTATGDSTPPTLVSANQNLAEDEYGRVVDFTFSEAMDPVFSTSLSHFVVTLPDIATTVEQPSEDVLRVTFNWPMVPGFDTVTLTSLVDLHGNPFPDTVQAISQPSPVANAFAGNVQATTVANSGGDFVSATTTQAFDPESAVLPASWSLVVDGNPVDLSLQTIGYDFLGKTLRIDLAFDLVNGESFTLQGLGTREVDGQAFVLSQTQTVGGETTAPFVSGARQNRTADSTGVVVDVQVSEDVQTASAETPGNWISSGGQNVVSATLMPGLDLVRLAFDSVMVPGDVTLSAQNLTDLAGNVMTPQAGIVLTSTDTTPPTVLAHSGDAHEGANNDVIELAFDDDMVVGDVTDVSRWALESPDGTARATAGAVVLYDPLVRRARLRLENGVNLRRGDDYSVSLSDVRDIGGNAVSSTALIGPVIAETTLPYVHTVWRPGADPDELEVRFSEPCDFLADLYDGNTNPAGTRYVLRTSGGTQRGLATSAVVLDDGLGARVNFGMAVAASDRIDVFGPQDLVGNPLFPALLVPTVAEDAGAPGLASGLSIFAAISGEDNDLVTVRFDRPISPWTAADHVHYTLTGPTTIVKRTRNVVFDGIDTVIIPVRSNTTDYDLLSGAGYDLMLDGILSAQGVPMPGPQTDAGILAGGDTTGPDVPAGRVRIDPSTSNALLVEFNEAVAPPSATDIANYDYDGSNVPLTAALLGHRAVRLVFSVAPMVGRDLVLNVADRAGNPSGVLTRAVAAADATGPLVVSVDGLLRPGWGSDEVHVNFDEPVTTATALNAANYTVQSGGVPRSLSGATLTYTSATNRVTIRLAGGQDLRTGAGITVGVSNVRDMSGVPMAAALTVGGTAIGDSLAPSFSRSFVNWRLDEGGAVVDVLFSEDVDAAFAGNVANWTASGGITVVLAELRERNHFRLTLSGPLALAGTLQMNALPDVAGNVSGAIATNPAE